MSSVYQVIVEEERPRRLRREPGSQDCFPVPLTFDAALARGLVHYFGAELAASSLPEAMPFTVGAPSQQPASPHQPWERAILEMNPTAQSSLQQPCRHPHSYLRRGLGQSHLAQPLLNITILSHPHA